MFNTTIEAMDEKMKREILDELRSLADQMEQARERRDELILAAMQSGISRAELAEASRLNRSRLYQILHGE